MIVGDTSAWVDYLRGRRTRAAIRLAEVGDDLATTDVVVMELLMGARDDAHWRQLQRMLGSFERLSTATDDFEQAASIFRRCRRHGDTPRSIADCLIAAVAIRTDAAVLHNDRDFAVIARHVDLRIDG